MERSILLIAILLASSWYNISSVVAAGIGLGNPKISSYSMINELPPDVFISVKTSGKYHQSRLRDILDTWFQLAPGKIWFFTDVDDEAIQKETEGRLVATACSDGHNRQALSCKMGWEMDFFMTHAKHTRWFCHFDDDNYVNVPNLLKLLAQFNSSEPVYLGKPSTRDPITLYRLPSRPSSGKASFWFGTGGAGFCLSRHLLVDEMRPFVADGTFAELADRIRLPDDVTVGYVSEHLLGNKLVVSQLFHSHLESMRLLPLESLSDQVSLSAGSYTTEANVVPVPELFSAQMDPQRFRSLHCYLFPAANLCERKN